MVNKNFCNTLKLPLPEAALEALNYLECAGYDAWIVGGFVRDSLLNRDSHDIDIATAAPWIEVARIFNSAGWTVRETGTAHGTVTVIRSLENSTDAFEITTFRRDGGYEDARHPRKVEFVSSIEEDLARRDFTINALAYHPAKGLLDPFGGADDLDCGVIRAIGVPEKRFQEDALRILRGCRFESQFGFDIEPETKRAMLESKALVLKISKERITEELTKLAMGDYVCQAVLDTVDILGIVLPELVAMKGFDQHNKYHIYDALEHCAQAAQAIPAVRELRWTALLHDIGKPGTYFRDTDGMGHFYGHPALGVEMVRGIFGRLSFSRSFESTVLTLIEHHDDVVDPTPKAVRRMLSKLGGDLQMFHWLCDMKRADARAQGPLCAERVGWADDIERIAEQICAGDAADAVFSVRDLAVNGNDLMEIGIAAGPQLGAILETALEAVLDEQVPNDRDALLAFAMQAYQEKTSKSDQIQQ